MTDPTWTDDPADNSTAYVSGGSFAPDMRSDAEKRRGRRRQLVSVWMWRLRGLLPRGWKDPEDY